jgi:hypothetical protein
MTTTNPDQVVSTENKYNILLSEIGFSKLETFLKIATQRADEFFIEINPEQNCIKMSFIDPSHISNVTGILTEEDITIENLDHILQFNLKSNDIYKILTLHADSEIRIVPALDKDNNFDLLKFIISQSNVVIKEVYVPILETANEDLFDQTKNVIQSLLDKDEAVIIKMELAYFIEMLKESEIFNNERIRFNVVINGSSISKISVDTFDDVTDKTRRIKNNLFEGLHFGRVKLNNKSDHQYSFNVLASYIDLKKLVVASKIYTDVSIILSKMNPLAISYNEPDETIEQNKDTVIALLAPIINRDEPPSLTS